MASSSTQGTQSGLPRSEHATGHAAVPPTPTTLSAPQLHALFDILTHHETYREIQDFRDPDTIYGYGTPFVERRPSTALGKDGKEDSPARGTYAAQSTAPILHMLFNRTVMTLPPAKTLPRAFWHTRIQGMVAQLAEAELSESYDQGAMGTRKMLATASSALIESLGRGALGGYPRARRAEQTEKQEHQKLADRTYNTTNAADFARAWDDVLRAMVYDNLVDELFAYCAEHEKDSIEGHSPAVRAAADYIVVHIAEFLHSVFVRSPNGRYLTKLVESVQQLIPYTLVRQTLRVSNAASMINGMMKLLLAKLSVGGLTNWIGLTSTADDGMNLLQRIMSLVLSYDASSFKKAAEKVEKDKAVSHPQKKAQLAALREHLARPRAYHEAVRRESATPTDAGKTSSQHKSLVVAILESVDPSLLTPALTDAQHTQLTQYYAALLSVHDRREITNVFCRQSPDLFTQALKDGVAAFDPTIRGIHDKIDLKEHVTDIEGFINEFIEVSKGVRPSTSTSKRNGDERILPTVKDYVELLRRNRHLLYKWLHRVAHDTPDIREMFRGWAVETIKLFRGPDDGQGEAMTVTQDTALASGESRLHGGAGTMSRDLDAIFGRLSPDAQARMLSQLDEHVAYLWALDEAASQQRQALLDKINAPACDDDSQASSTNSTPTATKQAPCSGRFIVRWQELLDDTLIGPATAEGPLRRGRDVAHVATQGKTSAANAAISNSGVGGGGSPAHKLHSWKYTGLFSGISSTPNSRSTSPERITTPPDASGAGRPNVGPRPPNVEPVVDELGKDFRQLLVERSAKHMMTLDDGA
ncbi:hypothetical protein SCUCBS95973_004062 [Sporothrix curviconia]|uniref:Px domain containing protein n=1 Tax=Sporothrix curviconia TaxID=1260050 RepID=A0ABP0BKJ6_9PEZI